MKRYLWLMIFYWGLLATVEAGPLIIFAAASTINVVQEAARAYQQQHPVEIRTSFASSSTLAKQIDQGAPAHIILSANTLWMDFLEQKQRLVPQSRFNLFGNRLVIITPKRQTLSESIQWDRDFDLASIFRGTIQHGRSQPRPGRYLYKRRIGLFQLVACVAIPDGGCPRRTNGIGLRGAGGSGDGDRLFNGRFDCAKKCANSRFFSARKSFSNRISDCPGFRK